MKKVIIIGCPGSGKSTFARALHEITSLPLIHLDMLNWNADGTTVPREVFRKRLDNALQDDCWIIDGNYSSTMELRLAACDTVIFLDYPTELCLAGAMERRGKPRSDIPWTEAKDAPPDEEFLNFIRSYEQESRPGVLELLANYPQKNIITFTSRSQADNFLQTLQSKMEETV